VHVRTLKKCGLMFIKHPTHTFPIILHCMKRKMMGKAAETAVHINSESHPMQI
jgi:hypothetical protein